MRVDEQPDDFDAMLREDARRDEPAFSPMLHDRVMRRVEMSRDSFKRPTLAWPKRFAIAAAAGLAIAITGWLFYRSAAPKPTQMARVTLPSPSTFEPIVKQTIAAGDAAHDARFGYLDQDIESFATFVRETVPSAPLPRRG